MQILGIDSQTTVWSNPLQLYRGTLKLNVKNNSASTGQAFGSALACGPFVDDGADCVVNNNPTISAGATATIDLTIPLWPTTTGDIKVVVGTSYSSHTDSALVHVSVTNDDGDVWTAQLIPFPQITYTPSITHGTSATVAANILNSQSVVLTNNGNTQATYTISVSCTGALTSCATTTTRTLAPGAPSSYTASYRAGAVGSSGQLRIIMTAPARPSGLVQADTSNLTVNAADLNAPSVWMTPVGDVDPNTGDLERLFLFNHVDTITVYACDVDGTLGAPTLTLAGVALSPISVVASNISPCNTSKEAKFVVNFPGGYSGLEASVSDGYHSTQSDAGYAYNDAMDVIPTIAPVHSTPQVQPNTTVTDTFLVANPGWHAVTYGLVNIWCWHSVGGACTANVVGPTSVSVAAGASARVPVTYTTTSAWGAQTTVSVTAQYVNVFQAVGRTGTFTASTPTPSTSPIITVTPGTGTVFTTASTGQIRIDYCDIDDAITQRDVTWQGQALSNSVVASSQIGCAAAGYSIYNNLALVPWQQNLVVTARDFAGHVTTSTTTFTYAAPLINYRPTVTATADWHRLPPQASVTAADTFTIQNRNASTAAYSLAALCGSSNTLSNCVANKGSVSLTPFASDVVVVTYTRSGALDHPDTLKLAATYTSPIGGVIADTGKKVVVAPSVEAAPIITGSMGVGQIPPNYIGLAGFTMRNPGSFPVSYAVLYSATNGFQINDYVVTGSGPVPVYITVPAGQSVSAFTNVRSPTTATGIGTVMLTASYVATNGAKLSASATDSVSTGTTTSSGGPRLIVSNTSPTLPPSSTTTQRFTVTNTGTSASVTYTSNCSTGGAIVSCGALSHNSATVGSQPDTIALTVTTAASANLTGTITLTATSGTVSSTGTITVTTGASSGPVTISTVAQLNPGSAIARDQCLTIAAGDDAAYECGDLRLVHALPTTTTLNKARTPILIYTSAHAQPVTLVQADVTIDNASSSLAGSCVTQIQAMVRFAATDQSQRVLSWNGPCGQIATRRIAIPVDAHAHSHATGVYHYSLEVQATTASGLTFTASDTAAVMAVVDRASSPFGAGWWLDGLEQLSAVPNHSDQLLWIGGDGSTRLYAQQALDTFVVRPRLDRPDSIVALRTGGTIVEYRRKLRNGAYVSFDSYYRHTSTVNALGHTTRFVWHAPGSAQLDSLVLPVPSGATRRAYSFGYTNGLLTSVAAPLGANGVRIATFSRNGSDLSVTDPGLPAAHYISDASGRIIIRKNRLGDGTRYDYDPSASVLTRVALDMSRNGTPGDSIRSSFCSAEAATLANCANALVDPSAVRTLLDGPREDVQDTTAFYLTRFGAPRKIVDALGHATNIERSDSLWPMLATKVIDARGHTVLAAYDSARALLRLSTDVNPNSSSLGVTTGDAITNYTWHPRWDRVTEIAGPMNLTTHIVYDATTGNRLEQSVGSSHTNRTTFAYDPGTRLVTGITTTQSATPTRLDYDALGNLWHTTTPKGFVTTTLRNATGRDSVVMSPIDSLQAQFRTQSYLYDVADRLTSSVDSALSGSVSQTMRIVNDYDDEGHLKAVSRSTTPDTAHVGTLITDYTYDPAGRKLTDHDRAAPDNYVARWHYDPAGNVLEADTKNSRVVTMRYDTLNRLSHRTIPRIGDPYGSVDDVQDFTYDAVGNLVMAISPIAQVVRTYTLGGALEGDSLALHAADLATSGMAHGYRLVNHYDLAGRRISQDQPPNLLWIAAGSATAGSLNSYGYDLETGALATVTDQRGNAFRYHYNSAGLLDSLLMPGGIVETHSYDDDSRETRRLEVGSMGTIHDDHSFRDAAGRALAVTVGGFASPGGSGSFTYAGLGPVTRSAIDLADLESIQLTTDGFGHTIKKQQAGTESDPGTKLYQYTYEASSNRLLQISGQLGTTGTDVLTHGYDATGDLTQQSYTQTTPMVVGEGTNFVHVDAWWSVLMGYDAAGRLLTVDRATVNDHTNWQNDLYHRRTPAAVNTGYGSYEEYRYDPLGRRVWKRTHRDSYCTDEARAQSIYQAECASAVTVTVWDGDQALYEIRAAAADSLSGFQLEHNIDNPIGSGTPFVQFSGITYLHGAGIDRPLELIRAGEVQVLHTSWRGAVDASTNTSGQFSTCGLSLDGSCVNVKWPGQEMGLTYTRPYTARASAPWYGDLSQGQLDASGKMYMRNRYYDPVTGRFTQEDPIGLAGGTNLYGFGGGDQVNYSDPLGLCPVCIIPLAFAAEDLAATALAGTIAWVGAKFAADAAARTPVYVQPEKGEEAATHAGEAQAEGKPTTGVIDRAGADGRRKERLRGVPTIPGMDRDEYPPAVIKPDATGVSIKHIPSSDNRRSGSDIGKQLIGLKDGTPIEIKVGRKPQH